MYLYYKGSTKCKYILCVEERNTVKCLPVKSVLFPVNPCCSANQHTSQSAVLSLYTIQHTNIMTICNARTSLAVNNHRLGDRLFSETVVLTVEWCHLLFAVCVQSLNPQLAVTETYTGNIMWQEDYWHSPRYRLADIIWQLRVQHCLPLSSQDIPQQ